MSYKKSIANYGQCEQPLISVVNKRPIDSKTCLEYGVFNEVRSFRIRLINLDGENEIIFPKFKR